MGALAHCRSDVSVDDDACSSKDGDGGDRHSWGKRIQLQKQSKEQLAGDTDTLFACGRRVFPGSDQALYLPLFKCLCFLSFITHRSLGLWAYLPLPAMLNSLRSG